MNADNPLNFPIHKPGRVVVAVDDGFARTKVCVPGATDGSPWAESSPVIREFATAISSRPGAIASMSGEVRSTWEVDGQRFVVSESIDDGDKVESETYHWSLMNRVIVNHYLTECGMGGRDIDLLVVGLPMKDYFEDGRLSSSVRAKMENLSKPVLNIGATPEPPRIKRVAVMPQGLSTLYDYMTDWKLEIVNEMPKRAVIIDIGGRTTDLAYIINDEHQDAKRSGSILYGVLNVQKSLQALIRERFKTRGDQPPDVMDDAIRNKEFYYRGQPEDISDLVSKAVRQFAAPIQQAIENQLGDVNNARKIMLVGGGAHVFRDVMLEMYPQAEVPSDPSWANVRGFWKAGSRQFVDA